jgi:hypothetical protein
MANQLTVVPAPEPGPLDDDLRDAAIAWADSGAELAQSLASSLREGASWTEIRPTALANARVNLRLLETLLDRLGIGE